ncbi:hypothetical protein GCM10025857_09540 [Alicyclobacillus contaminans]|uniref:hypothetical protein n=1 Tax=Alicyclobacillus contaminans TaxID=392016 RepID=UPI0003FDD340|nr:hypothetical protein [Alicyclobacillus contaminans]GMA49597.1 hypothetical protein GCM10025857_09540 [Alicyclobacillus contaminans]
MQLNTVIRLGSLAFNVAQDEKVQQLFTMIHKGAKRRGMIGPWQPPAPPRPQSTPAAPSGRHPVPFAPVAHPVAPLPQAPVPPAVSKYLTVDNAKKALSVAGQITSMLMK